MNRKLAPDSKVDLPCGKPTQEVPRRVAEVSCRSVCRGRNRESAEVYSSSTRSGCVTDVNRLARHKVRTEPLLNTRGIERSTSVYIKGQRRATGNPRVQ